MPFDSAATGLLTIPPEQLEQYVVERAYKEGVSELHVVERILTSQIAQKLRMFFGTNDAVLSGAYRLRELRAIKLAATVIEADVRLAEFRLAEVWEAPDLINRALAPIACGDVFETDDLEGVPGEKNGNFFYWRSLAISPFVQKTSRAQKRRDLWCHSQSWRTYLRRRIKTLSSRASLMKAIGNATSAPLQLCGSMFLIWLHSGLTVGYGWMMAMWHLRILYFHRVGFTKSGLPVLPRRC